MYLSSVSSRLLLYDTNSWDLKKSYGCYDGVMRDISWSDDSKYLLQVNSKGLIEILSAADHDIRSLQHIPLKETWSASFHREGHRNIAIGTKSGNVMIWDTKNKTITKTFPSPAQQSHVNFISYNAKNTSLASTLQNGDTVIYGLVSNIPVLTIKLPCSKSISAMKFHQESRSLLGLATDEGHIVLRDITTNKDKVFFENIHGSPVSDFTFSPINKDVLLSSGYDKIMHVFDIRLQNVVSTIRTSYALTSIAMNAENHVALGTKTGHILVYDLRDLTNPYKVLKGHEEEVKKLAFQPIKKKTLSTEVSLREEVDMNLQKNQIQSPARTRTSDVLLVNDTPPKPNIYSNTPEDNTVDSFLVEMGFNKTHDDFEEDINRTTEFERKSDRYEVRYHQLDVDKNISKVSTPLNSRVPDNFILPSPLNITNGVTDDIKSSNINLSNIMPVNNMTLDKKVMDELKDFIKLSLSDVGDDNRSYFLHVMMALTKQKLFLEKQLANLNNQMQMMMQNQSSLIETNRILTLQLEQLRGQMSLL